MAVHEAPDDLVRTRQHFGSQTRQVPAHTLVGVGHRHPIVAGVAYVIADIQVPVADAISWTKGRQPTEAVDEVAHVLGRRCHAVVSAAKHLGPQRLGDSDRVVCRAVVADHNLVYAIDRGNAVGNIVGLVERANDGRDRLAYHALPHKPLDGPGVGSGTS